MVKESPGNTGSPPTLPSYKESFVRLLYTIIVLEFAVITILLFGFSNEYLNNAYQQTWIRANLPLLGLLLHGEVDALFIGAAIGAMVLLIQRRVQVAKSQEDTRRGVKPATSSYTPTPVIQNLTLQGNPIPNHAPPSRTKAREEPPQDENIN
jgi:hypothetical protein